MKLVLEKKSFIFLRQQKKHDQVRKKEILLILPFRNSVTKKTWPVVSQVLAKVFLDLTKMLKLISTISTKKQEKKIHLSIMLEAIWKTTSSNLRKRKMKILRLQFSLRLIFKVVLICRSFSGNQAKSQVSSGGL